MTTGLTIMKVCVTGSTRCSAMPSSLVLSTVTLPSFAPGNSAFQTGFSDRVPAMIPSG